MVAIVAGNGLGLFNTSQGVLGQAGQLGEATQGRAGERVYVNASTGNLVVQREDEWLVGVGPDLSLLRTYNSLAGGTDDNGDNWRLGLSRRVIGLSGSANTAGSTVKRVGEDGMESLFSYDASQGLYVSKEGAGAFDTLSYNAVTKQWTWVDGSSQTLEIYDVTDAAVSLNARLMSVKDTDGRQLKLGYASSTSALITEIATWSASAPSGEKVAIAYDAGSNNIASFTTTYVEAGQTKTLKRVSYTYDTYNRLKEVTVDLTPTDLSVTDGALYKTSYTYDDAVTPGTKRLKTLTQTDGSRLEFTYAADGRIAVIKELIGAEVRETSFDYSVAGVTKVTNPLGQVIELTYDVSTYNASTPVARQLLAIKAPSVNGTSQTTTYAYDSTGNVIQMTDPRGQVTTYQYDNRGNLTGEQRADGTVVERTYNAANQVLSESSTRAALMSTPLQPSMLISAGSVSVVGSAVTKVGGINRWDASVSSSHGYSSGALVSFKPAQTDKNLMVGLTTDPAANSSYDAIDWALYVCEGGVLHIYENGIGVAIPDRYVVGDTLAVSYDGQSVKYLKNGVAFRTVAVNISQPLFVDSTFYSPDGKITDLSFTAYPVNQPTTRFIYGSTGQLRYVISPQGGVTEYLYYTNGTRKSSIVFTGNGYINPQGGVQASEADLMAWVAAQDKTQTQRADYTYDFRGLISNVIRFAKSDASGNGVWDGTQNRHVYVYDQAGNLLQKIDARGDELATQDTAWAQTERVRLGKLQLATGLSVADKDALRSRYATTYAYDGMNRVKTQSDGLGNTTTTVYDDANLKTTVTLANGLVTTSTYDQGGHLLGQARADGSTALGATSYTYDKLGRLSSTISPTGEQSFVLYDSASRRVGEVSAQGELVEYVYNLANQVTQVKRYANTISSTSLTSLVTAVTNRTQVDMASIRSVLSPGNDRVTYNIYDNVGRLAQTVDGAGAVVAYSYDSNGQVTSTLQYATALTAGQLLQLSGATAELKAAEGVIQVTTSGVTANIVLAVNAADRLSRNFYNSDGLLIGELDAENRYTAYGHDMAGQLVKKTRHANTMVGVLAPGNTPPSVSSSASGTAYVLTDSANDQVTQFIYNGKGQLTGEVDALGFYSAYEYDAAGNRVGVTRYLNAVQGVFDGKSAPAVLAAGATAPATGSYVFAHSEDQKTLYGFDANNRLVSSQMLPMGLVTTYTYDSVGNLTQTVKAAGQSEARTQQQRLDKLGRVVAELNGEGSKALAALLAATPTATQAQIDAIWSTYGLQHQYDNVGRRVATVAPDGSSAAGVKTVYYYDKVGRLTHSINALGEVVQYGYNSFGEQLTETRLGTRLSNVSALAGGLDTNLGSTISALLNASKDSKRSKSYDQRGLLSSQTDALGVVTSTYQYNSFGQLLSQVERQSASVTAQTSYGYNRAGQLLSTQALVLGRTTQRTFDAFGRVISQVDGNGRTTSYVYDRLGRQVQVKAPGGMLQGSATYDAFGRTLTQTDSLGQQTVYAYDSANRRVTMTTAEGIQTVTESNRHGETVKVTDGRGNATTYAYDADGQLLSTNGPLGVSTSQAYDKAGRVCETRDALGTVTRSTYDAANRVLTRAVDPSGLNLTSEYRYDALGQVAWRKDATGVWTQTVYDLEGQVKAVVVDPKRSANWVSGADDNPQGFALRTEYTYDAQGRTLSVIEGAATPAAKTTQYEYDAAGRRTKETVDPAGLNLTTLYAYDNNDNLIRRTDAKGQITSYVYDEKNQQIYQVAADGSITRNIYDHQGRVSRTVAYASRIAVTASIGRATVEAWVGGGTAADHVVTYIYDKDGRQTHRVDAQGYVTRSEYDKAGNVIQTTAYATLGNGVLIAAQSGGWVSYSFAGVGTAALDRIDRTVYDAANRPVWRIDAAGGVTQNTFDSNSRITKVRRFANPVTTVAATRTSLPAGEVAISGTGLAVGDLTVVLNDSKDQITHQVYDNAGRLTWTVDAEKYATKYTYDGNDRLKTSTRYNTALASYSAGSGAPSPVTHANDAATTNTYDTAGRLTDTLDAEGVTQRTAYDSVGRVTDVTQAHGDASQQVITHFDYDKAGRLVAETQAYGTGDAATTKYELNALGQRVKLIDPRGTEAATGTSAWAVAERVRILGGTTATRATALTVGSADYNTVLAAYTTTQVFDELGRIKQTTDALGGSIYTEYDAFGNAVKVTDPNGNAGYFYFDKNNQSTLHVDPEGYAVETTFDAFGQALTITRLDTKITAALSTATRPTLSYVSTKDAKTTLTHDKLGRQTQIQDAEGFSEFMVFDTLGNKTEYTNKLGGKFTYTHDKLGRVLTEKQPVQVKELNADGSIKLTNGVATLKEVVTRFTYDSRGNVLTKVEGEGLVAQQRTTPPTETRWYDKRGNLIEVEAADKGRTLSYWDALNRKVAEVNPVGTLTQWDYDDAGQVIAQRICGDAVTVAAGQRGGGKPSPVNASKVRETLYAYDANGRQTAVTLKNVTFGNTVDGKAFNVTTADVTTYKVYSKTGQVIQETDGRGNSTYHYYDKLGNRTLQVDAERYVTQWTYDEAGSVLTESRFAQPLPAATVVSTSSDTATLLQAVPTPTDKRTVEYVYDRMGRVKEKRVKGVEQSTVNNDTGNLSTTTADALTKFDYNALGNITKQTDAANEITDMAYDLQGRLIKTQAPTIEDWAGTNVRPTTDLEYNALGLQGRAIQRGKDNAAETDDRITSFVYGKNGVRTSEKDPEGNVTAYGYDAMYRITKRDITRLNADATSNNDRLRVRYDKAGRQVEQITTSKLSTATTYTQLKSDQLAYNAWGDIISKGENGGAQRKYEYDSAGRLWRSNDNPDGAAKAYYYDQNGNATLELTSSSQDLMSSTVLPNNSAASLSTLLSANSANPKFNLFDKLNRLTDSYEPSMTGSTQAASVVQETKTVTTTTQDPFELINMGVLGGDFVLSADGTNIISDSRLNYYSASPLLYIYAYSFRDSPRYGIKVLESVPSVVEGGYRYGVISETLHSGYPSDTGLFQDTSSGRIKLGYIDGRLRNELHFKALPLSVNNFSFKYRTIGAQNWTTASSALWSNDNSYVASMDSIYNYNDLNFLGEGVYSGVEYEYWYEAFDLSGVKICGAMGVFNLGQAVVTRYTDGYRWFYKRDRSPPLIRSQVADLRPPVTTATYQHYLNWQLGTESAFDLSVHRKQVYNAYGEQTRQIQYKRNASNALEEIATDLSYNALGLLVEKKDPTVSITLENGFQKNVRPTTRYFYDAVGRLVGTRDANGNESSQTWTAGSMSGREMVRNEFRADRTSENGGTSMTRKRSRYDIFGLLSRSYDERWDGVVAIDPYATSYGYNKNGYLVSVDRPGQADDNYVVDSQGQRISTTLPQENNTTTRSVEKTFYDALGRITKTITASGITATYDYAWAASIAGGGGWRRTTTTAEGTLVDDTDVFGRIRWHKDLGNHAFTYRYNNAGLLQSQTSLAADGTPSGITATLVYTGQNITFAYYGNGLLKETIDNAKLSWTKYRYDDRGNRVFEGYARNYGTTTNPSWEYYQYAEAVYDDANRLVKISDPKHEINYEYDAVGNRRRVLSKYHDGMNGGLQTQDFWYAYDKANRFTITMGTLNSAGGNTRASTEASTSVQVVIGAQGHLIGYDKAGRRKSDTSNTTTNGTTTTSTYSYTYDAEGYLEEVKLGTSRIAFRDNDARGRVMALEETSATGTTRHTFTYDADNNVKTDIENFKATAATTWVKKTEVANTLRASGLMNTSVNKQFNDSGTQTGTVTTTYRYEAWDDLKQKEIQIGESWGTGSTKLTYDMNGHIQRSHDVAGGRYFYYGTDADGRVLRRDEVDGPDKNPLPQNRTAAQRSAFYFQNYYFFNGREVGTVSSDPAAIKKDYAQTLAQSPQAYYKRQAVASADFDQNFQAIGPNYPGRVSSVYTVARTGESLQNIALAVWGDASMWYLIAEANGLTASSTLTAGQRLVIPNQVTNIHNNTQTGRVYDPSQALGDISPTLPDPPPPPGKKGCGFLGTILMIVVAVVATAFTAGLLAAPAGTAFAGFGATVSSGFTALGAGLGAGGLTLGGFALAGAAGSVASQLVGLATGTIEKFSWKGVAMGAIGSMVGGGLAKVNFGLGDKLNSFGNVVARAATGSVITQGIGVVTGLQQKFDWRGVAASAVGAGINNLIVTDASALTAAGFGQRVASGLVSGAARAAIYGQKPDWAAIAADSFGSALGDSVVSAIQRGDANNVPPVASAEEKAQILAGFAGGPGGDDPALSPVYGRTFAEDRAARGAMNAWPSGAGSDGDMCYPGDYPEDAPSGPRTYKVGKGDGLERIARAQYGGNWRAGVAALAVANNITQTDRYGNPIVRMGAELIVPDLDGLGADAMGRLGRAGGSVIAANSSQSSTVRRQELAAQHPTGDLQSTEPVWSFKKASMAQLRSERIAAAAVGHEMYAASFANAPSMTASSGLKTGLSTKQKIEMAFVLPPLVSVLSIASGGRGSSLISRWLGAQLALQPAKQMGAQQILTGMAVSGSFSTVLYIGAQQKNATPAGVAVAFGSAAIGSGVVKQGLNFAAALPNTAIPFTYANTMTQVTGAAFGFGTVGWMNGFPGLSGYGNLSSSESSWWTKPIYSSINKP